MWLDKDTFFFLTNNFHSFRLGSSEDIYTVDIAVQIKDGNIIDLVLVTDYTGQWSKLDYNATSCAYGGWEPSMILAVRKKVEFSILSSDIRSHYAWERYRNWCFAMDKQSRKEHS